VFLARILSLSLSLSLSLVASFREKNECIKTFWFCRESRTRDLWHSRLVRYLLCHIRSQFKYKDAKYHFKYNERGHVAFECYKKIKKRKNIYVREKPESGRPDPIRRTIQIETFAILRSTWISFSLCKMELDNIHFKTLIIKTCSDT